MSKKIKQEAINKIIELRKKNYTIIEIHNELEISTGFIHAIIKKEFPKIQKEKQEVNQEEKSNVQQ